MDNKFFKLKRIKAQVRQFAPVLFLIIALAFVVIGVSNHPILVKVRTAATDALTPVLSALYAPVRWVKTTGENAVDLFSVRADNIKLKKENEELRALQDKARQLISDNKKLAEQAKYRIPGEKRFITARVIADNGGAFSKTVLIEAGTVDGVRKGSVVLTPYGVLGHVVEVGAWSARVLLVTDYLSRIPVKVGDNEILAILTGDNASLLKLIAVPQGAEIKEDDIVVTSGHAGVYPSGLGVGKVILAEGDEIYVEPFSDREKVEFVRVVDFGLDGLLP